MRAKQLLEALALPLEIADRKAGDQITAFIRLADGKAASTNFRTSIIVDVPEATFDCCVPAARLSSALTSIAMLAGEAEAKISVKGKHLVLAAGRARYQLPTLPVQDFPLPAWPQKTVPIDDWPAVAAALKFAAHACTMADNRAFCHGVGTRDGWIAGSDGHRAALARWGGKLPDNLLLPLQAIQTLAALPVSAYATTEAAFFVDFQGGRFCAQQVVASYPDVGRVVPEKHKVAPVTVERAALSAAAAAILKTRTQTFCRIGITADTITLEDESTSEGSARVEVACVNPGEAWHSGINIGYLAQACEALDGEQLSLSFADKTFRFAGKAEGRAIVTMEAKV